MTFGKREGLWQAGGVGIVLAILGASSAAEARDDWRLWMEQKWSVKLTNTLRLNGKTEERFQDDMGDFSTQGASVGLSWKALSWLKLEPAYHYEWTERDGPDTNEHRIYLNVTPAWSWGPVTLEDRSRVEFRHVNGVDDWRYRNKPKLSVEFGRDWYAVEPYVAEELFYGHRAGEWNKSRFSVGLEKPLTKQLTADVYYMVESGRTGNDWNEFHVLGLVVGAAF